MLTRLSMDHQYSLFQKKRTFNSKLIPKNLELNVHFLWNRLYICQLIFQLLLSPQQVLPQDPPQLVKPVQLQQVQRVQWDLQVQLVLLQRDPPQQAHLLSQVTAILDTIYATPKGLQSRYRNTEHVQHLGNLQKPILC